MRRIVSILLLTLAWSLSAAQNDDPRIRKVAPAPGVKSVHVKMIIRSFSVENRKDTSWRVDTAARETKYFAKDGRIDSSYFRYYLPDHSYYGHVSDSSWICTSVTGSLRVSTSVSGNHAEVRSINPGGGHYEIIYAGDSMHYAWYNDNGERRSQHHQCSSPADSFWDYKSGGPFAKKVIAHADNRDTICYLNAKGRWMVKVINLYDSLGRPVVSEYYNRSVKDFDLITMWANHHVGDATLYLPKNGDKLSMSVRRTYNAQGLLEQEAWYHQNRTTPSDVKMYSYTFWEAADLAPDN